MGVPPIIQFNGIFLFKPSILGTPIYGNPHMIVQVYTFLQRDKPCDILDTSENSKPSTSPDQNLTKTTPCIEAKAGCWQLVCQDDSRCKSSVSVGCKNALDCQTCQVGCSPCEELGCPFRYSCTGVNMTQKPLHVLYVQSFLGQSSFPSKPSIAPAVILNQFHEQRHGPLTTADRSSE